MFFAVLALLRVIAFPLLPSLAVIFIRPSPSPVEMDRVSTSIATVVLSDTFLAEPVIFEIALPVPVSVTSSAGRSSKSVVIVEAAVCVTSLAVRSSFPPAPITTSPVNSISLVVEPSWATITASPAAAVLRSPTLRSVFVARLSEPASPLISLISLLAEERSTAFDAVVSLRTTLSETTAPPVCETEPSKVMPAEASFASSVPPVCVKLSPTVLALSV